MREFMAIAKALGDENRVRMLVALREDELCLCQLVEMLKLAPSTVSKHVDVLRQAGLLQMRKEGRWHFYRLAGSDAPAVVRDCLRWVLQSLKNEKVILSDMERLCCVRERDPKELTACYSRD